MMTSPRIHLFASTLAIVVLAVVAVLLAGSISAASERILTVFFISLIGVAGIGIYSGNSGILTFGHLSFMAIGAYAASILTLPAPMKAATLPNLPGWLAATQLGLVPATLVAVLLTAVFAAISGWAVKRLEGSAAVIATLGLLIIVHGVIIGWRDVTRGAQSFFGVPRETGVWTAAIGVVLALVIARLYRDSVSGLRLRAGREDPIAAGAVGIRVPRERLIAWVLSAAVMALAGALLAHFLGAFSAKKFYFVDTFLLLAMLIVGGMTTVTGAITGAVVITVVTELLRRLESGFSVGGLEIPPVLGTAQIGIGLIILFAMFRKADGLAGLKEWEERVFRASLPRPASARGPAIAEPEEEEGQIPLRAENLTMRFGGLTAVSHVSLEVGPGEIVGLIGPNGSGKTTCLNMLSGVLVPSEGTIRRGDMDLTGLSAPQFAEMGIARTFQNIRLFSDLTVYQNVLVAALSTRRGHRARPRAYSALERLGLLDKAGEDAGTLSYGDQRRVEIARALACQPSILFLDEPAAGMNREETEDLMSRLRGLASDMGIGILLVDHDLHLINKLCARIIVLNEGHLIAEGKPEEIRNNPAVIEAYLGRAGAVEAETGTEIETGR